VLAQINLKSSGRSQLPSGLASPRLDPPLWFHEDGGGGTTSAIPTAGAGPSEGGGMTLAPFDDELGVLPRSSLRSRPGGVLGVLAISVRLCSCCVGSRFPNSQHGMTMWPEGAISAWKQSVPGGSAERRL